MGGWSPTIGWPRGDRRIGGAPPAPVIPDAANMRGWVDSLDFDGSNNSTLTSGDSLASVVNKGTLGGVFSQGTGTAQPVYQAAAGPGGARPAAVLDGTDFLTSSLPMASWTFLHDGTGATIYSVVKTSTSAVHTIASTCNGGGTAIGVIHRYNTGFAASYAMNDGVALRIAVNGAAASVTNGSFDVYASTLTSASTPNANLYVNNMAATVATANSAGFTSTQPASTLVIGATPSATFPLVGQLAAVLVYQGVHDATQRAAVLAFLQTRYGVTFPTP